VDGAVVQACPAERCNVLDGYRFRAIGQPVRVLQQRALSIA